MLSMQIFPPILLFKVMVGHEECGGEKYELHSYYTFEKKNLKVTWKTRSKVSQVSKRVKILRLCLGER